MLWNTYTVHYVLHFCKQGIKSNLQNAVQYNMQVKNKQIFISTIIIHFGYQMTQQSNYNNILMRVYKTLYLHDQLFLSRAQVFLLKLRN